MGRGAWAESSRCLMIRPPWVCCLPHQPNAGTAQQEHTCRFTSTTCAIHRPAESFGSSAARPKTCRIVEQHIQPPRLCRKKTGKRRSTAPDPSHRRQDHRSGMPSGPLPFKKRRRAREQTNSPAPIPERHAPQAAPIPALGAPVMA